MGARIKSISLRTTKLQETIDFYEKELKLEIQECALQHFVLYSKEIRVVFLSTIASAWGS